MSANARHSKATPRWGTPPGIVRRAREALGGRIELDPMSEAAFNLVVGAERYYTEKDDCFTQSWRCSTMLINPAGGVVVRGWQRLVASWLDGVVGAAIWVGFSVEQLNILADEPHHPDDFSKLTLRQRIDFTTVHPIRAVVGRDGAMAALECGHSARVSARKSAAPKAYRCPRCICEPEPNGSPSHGNYITALGIKPAVFEAAFAGMGRFHHGRFAAKNSLRDQPPGTSEAA